MRLVCILQVWHNYRHHCNCCMNACFAKFAYVVLFDVIRALLYLKCMKSFVGSLEMDLSTFDFS